MDIRRTGGRKIRLALIFGGQSAEHDVSLASARSVLQSIDPTRYDVLPIGIEPNGAWRIGSGALRLLGSESENATGGIDIQTIEVQDTAQVVRALSPVAAHDDSRPIDVVFPVLHGPRGEDGAVQGMLELAGVPYVGAGVAGSAVGMDKILMKRLFLQAGLPVMPFVAVERHRWVSAPEAVARQIAETIGYPCFAKPANMGSSLGINRVDRPEDLAWALDDAARFDRRLLVERAAVQPRELECGVLGNERPEVSVVGEVLVHGAPFYDYEAKYQVGGCDLVVPADLPAEVVERVRDLARRAFETIDCAGLARVDFFFCPDGQIYLNELNTMPGFTPTSMFPLLWAASGLPYAQLIDRLVELALERHAER